MAAPCAAPLGARCAAPARLRQAGALRRAACRSLGATTVNTSGPYRRPMGPGGGGGGGAPRPAGGPPRPAGGGGAPRPGGSTFTPRPGGATFTPRPPSGPGGAPPSRVGGRPFVRRDQGPPPPPMNEFIRVPNVRLVDADKEMLGVFTREEALKKAEAAGLDLVMISPEADPPVCRLIDYSKYKYDQTIKAKEAQKKMAAGRQEVKELKMRYNIDTHDYEVRIRAASKFLKDGDKVKVLCQFRGREMEFKQIAYTMFEKFAADLKEDGVIESKANIDGRSLIMILGPGAKLEGKAAAAGAAKPAAQAAQAASRAAAAASAAANPKPPRPPKLEVPAETAAAPEPAEPEAAAPAAE